MKEIKFKGEVIARLLPSDSWAEGLGFYSNDEEYIQVGTWKYDSGKSLMRHIHNPVERSIIRTQEVIYVKQGRVLAQIYTLDEEFVEEFEAKTGDTIILLNCGHGYEILENGTQVIEVKNGPYLGAEVDRRRF